jgi:hypothetical protein
VEWYRRAAAQARHSLPLIAHPSQSHATAIR